MLCCFGLKRAASADYFDPTYRNKTLVREGIFKYKGNAMYIFGLLVLWIPGLLAALFGHLYIWAHYYTTELLDTRRIYNL